MMKRQNAVNHNALVSNAFDNINSAVGTELNEIVNVIEQHSRKQKIKANNTPAKVVAIVKTRAKTLFATAK